MKLNFSCARAGALLVLMLSSVPSWAQSAPPSKAATAPARTVETSNRTGMDAAIIKESELAPPSVAKPCAPGRCPFAGQTVTVLSFKARQQTGALRELKEEYEAATGAKLEIVEVSFNEHFDNFISDVTNRVGQYDATLAGSWWLGDLVVAGDFIIPYDKYYGDPRFPQWDIKDVLPGPRSLLEFGGKKYMVANDHDGQVMYYRRDLFESLTHQAAFKHRYGYPLAVPQTWDEFRDIAEYFNGKDLNGDGQPGSGVSMHLKVGEQGMFHFMSFSAPFVIGPTNPKLYWFDPKTMKPLVDSPGHLRALQVLKEIAKFGPKEMLAWDIGNSWDYFLAGKAALTFTWGDLGGLAQEAGSRVRGKIGTAHIPGTREYYDIRQKKWIKTSKPNLVANSTGGNWAGVISRYAKHPEAAYYLWALLASKQKSSVYAARGWDGIDPGRYSHFLAPDGGAKIEEYLRFGWDQTDIRGYLHAYFENYSNKQQLPYLRVPGTFSYWRVLDVHLAEAMNGQLSAEVALEAAAADFEEITLRLGRAKQLRAYRSSLGL
jgi:multiple sugar transport system substrate-binding protein